MKLNANSAEIFIGYRDFIGILDIQSIEDYLKENRVQDIYLLTQQPLSERVQSYLNEHLKERVTVIVTSSSRKTAENIKQQNKGKQAIVIDLEEFGRRGFARCRC